MIITEKIFLINWQMLKTSLSSPGPCQAATQLKGNEENKNVLSELSAGSQAWDSDGMLSSISHPKNRGKNGEKTLLILCFVRVVQKISTPLTHSSLICIPLWGRVASRVKCFWWHFFRADVGKVTRTKTLGPRFYVNQRPGDSHNNSLMILFKSLKQTFIFGEFI